MPAHAVVFRQGDECGQYLLVLQGSVKVLTRALNGREIVLYRLGAGDSCVLTTACLFGKTRYPAEGVTESVVTALTLPAQRLSPGIAGFRGIPRVCLSVLHDATWRASSPWSRRLPLAGWTAGLPGTCYSSARRGWLSGPRTRCWRTELGSSREVISRLLKELEIQGKLELQRGSIRLLDSAALRTTLAYVTYVTYCNTRRATLSLCSVHQSK